MDKFSWKTQPLKCDTGRNKKSANQLHIEETELCIKSHFFKKPQESYGRIHQTSKEEVTNFFMKWKNRDHSPRLTCLMRLASLYYQKLMKTFMTKGNITNTSKL